MIYTNKLNLPLSIVNSVKESHEPIKNRYSITELLDSNQEIYLRRKYYNEIEVDVSDCISTLFGTAVHKILEDNDNDPNSEKEIKMEVDFNGYTIVGKFDRRVLKDSLIEDYKTAKCSKVIKEDFEDYKLQGLSYAWMTFKTSGVIIRHLRFYIFLKDWSKIKLKFGSNYPSSAIYIWEYEIQDSDYDFIENYIKEKLDHINEIIPCSDKERWYTGSEYAVYKNVNDKRAALVTYSEKEARDFITNKLGGSGEIQFRKGEYLKCKYYCNCSKFCEQNMREDD